MLPQVRVALVERVLGPVREPVREPVLVLEPVLVQVLARPVRVLLVRPAQRLAV